MRLNEFHQKINEVRMGAKDLKAPTIPITMGFEAEVLANGEGHEQDLDDEFDRFTNQWEGVDRNTFWSDEFRDNYRYATTNLDLVPLYGYASEYEAEMLEYKQRLQRFENQKNDQIELTKLGDAEADEVEKLILWARAWHRHQTEENIRNKVEELDEDRVKAMLRSYDSNVQMFRTPAPPSEEEFSKETPNTDFVKNENGDILSEDEFSEMTPEEFFNLFEQGEKNYETWVEDVFYEYYNEAEREAFDSWISNKQGDGSAFSYTSETLDGYTEYGIDIFDSYHGGTKNPNRYTLEPDSSLDNTGGYSGVEIVSPVFNSYERGISELKSVLQMIREDDFMTNSDTGLHINIGFPTIHHEEIDLLKLFLFLGDSHILKLFGRENNSFAYNYIDHIYKHLSGGEDKSVTNDMIRMKSYLKSHADKYRSVNLSHLITKGYFEIRAMGNKGYERKEEEIIRQINRFVKVIAIAADPNAHKDEYLKKLYKLKNDAAPGASAIQKRSNKLIKALENDMDTVMRGNGYNTVEDWMAYRHDDKPYTLSPNTKIMLRDYLMTLPKEDLNADWWVGRQNTPVSRIFLQVAKKRGLL